ncbi:phosphoglycerate mutase-like protein [Atractiella rhizophila]|nr:phosphoglycerate mutase-like protein [Atractiella rhizophila]
MATLVLWAGHRDAPLTNHGHNQALRVGEFFSEIPITAIYTSDLKRAHSTALAIADANKTSPVPPFSITPLLREQFFGQAEGQPWDKGPFSGLPWEDQRKFKFEGGESLEDVSRRADTFIKSFLRPHITSSPTSTIPDPDPYDHIVVVAQSVFSSVLLSLGNVGIMIRELIRALYKGQSIPREVARLGGLLNTAWNQVEIKHLGSYVGETEEGEFELPLLSVQLVCQNQHTHLNGLVRQKGGIGSCAHDEKQTKLSDFFGGALTSGRNTPVLTTNGMNGHGEEKN